MLSRCAMQLSRALLSRAILASFRFFAFSGKADRIHGSAAARDHDTGLRQSALGVASVLVFFVIGAILLAFVDAQRGINAAADAG